jgi:hypothetical protein
MLQQSVSGAHYATSGIRTADALLMQEIRLAGDSARRSETCVPRAGWTFAINDAQVTQGEVRQGFSGGTAIGTRRHQGLSTLHGWKSFVLTEARVSIARWQAFIRGGITLASVYLVTGEGPSESNVGILDELGRTLVTLGRPFVIGGDFQMTPGELQGTGWVQRLGAALVAPPSDGPPSCSSGRTIDFFVAAGDLAPLVEDCYVVEAAETMPHRPTRMAIRASGSLPPILVLKSPMPFPIAPPFGPRRCCREWQEVDEVFQQRPSRIGEVCEQQQQTQDLYAEWARQAEDELAGVFDIEEDRKSKYFGRGEAPRIRWCRPSSVRGSLCPNVWKQARAC